MRAAVLTWKPTAFGNSRKNSTADRERCVRRLARSGTLSSSVTPPSAKLEPASCWL